MARARALHRRLCHGRSGLAPGLAVALALAGGCDWRSFDDLADKVPVVKVEAPDKFAAGSDFGRVTLPIAAPADDMAVAARYLVSGSGVTGLALVHLDGTGHASRDNILSSALDNLNGAPIVSMAEIPGVAGGKALMGAVNASFGQVLELSLGGSGGALQFTLFNPPETLTPDFGLGVAAQSVAGVGAADAEYVVVSDDTVYLYPDGAADTAATFVSSSACPIALPPTLAAKYRQNRAVAVGTWGTAAQIAVGTPGQGTVSFLDVSATGGVTCAFTITGSESRFGQSLAAGDFNGDHVLDLLVGAPPSAAYLFLGPLSATSTPFALPSPAGVVEFGATVAAVNVDGAGGDEAVVGDPDATVEGADRAGQVVVFGMPGGAGAPVQRAELSDRYPAVDGAYGASVGALRFCKTPPCASSDLLRLTLIGSASQTFVAFKLSPDDPDPRFPAP